VLPALETPTENPVGIGAAGDEDFFLFNHYSHATYLDHGEIIYSPLLSARWRHVASAPLPSSRACPKKM